MNDRAINVLWILISAGLVFAMQGGFTGLESGLFSFGISYALFRLFNRFFPMRVTEHQETIGLNIAEHGASTETHSLLSQMATYRETGNLERRVASDESTEVGQIAAEYNRVLEKVSSDNDTHRQLTERLRNREAQLRDVLESAPDCIICMDHEGRIIEFNSAAERTFGYERADVLGSPMHERILPPAYRADHIRGLTRYRETGEGRVINQRTEVTAMRSDGSEFPVELAIVATPRGESLVFTAYLRDLTRQKQAERESKELQEQLLANTHRAGMAEVATGVLHNVGNVLNSVNVSATLITEQLRQSRVGNLTRVTDLIEQHCSSLGEFLTQDERGRLLPNYLHELSQTLVREHDSAVVELRSLTENIEHIKEIVAMQQSLACAATAERVDLVKLLEDAVKINDAGLFRHGVEIKQHFDDIPEIITQKHKILQILINLISNAKYAVTKNASDDKRIVLRAFEINGLIRIEVEDNGMGIESENLPQLFRHGFTTKDDGHGYGLHSSALAANEVGGSITAHSDGIGHGAKFVLEIPVEEESANDRILTPSRRAISAANEPVAAHQAP